VDSLSRVARRPGPEILARPLPEPPTGRHSFRHGHLRRTRSRRPVPEETRVPGRTHAPRGNDSPGARSWRRAPFCTCTTVRYKGMLVAIRRPDHMLGKVAERVRGAASVGALVAGQAPSAPGRRAHHGGASL